MSRTFLACFRPDDLLPIDPVLKKQYRYDMDYYDSLSAAVEAMRLRAWNISNRLSRQAKITPSFIEGLDTAAHLEVDRLTSFRYQHLHETIVEKGEFIQRLLPPGDICDMRLCFLHHRGVYYTGVLQ